MENFPSFSAREGLNLPRTKRGRKVVPPLEFWRGEAIRRDFYGNTLEIVSGTPETKPKKRKKLRVAKPTVEEEKSSDTDDEEWDKVVICSFFFFFWIISIIYFKELLRLNRALMLVHPTERNFWGVVANHVGTRTPEACAAKYYSLHPGKKKGKKKLLFH